VDGLVHAVNDSIVQVTCSRGTGIVKEKGGLDGVLRGGSSWLPFRSIEAQHRQTLPGVYDTSNVGEHVVCAW
jgi:hypothetical protein